MTTAVGARALAFGSDLFFAPGVYRPSSPAGRRVIGHELAHVVDQRRRGARIQRVPDPLSTTLTDQQVLLYTDAELQSAETTLVNYLDGTPDDDTLRAGASANLITIQSQMRARGLRTRPRTGLDLTADSSAQLDANQLLSLQTRYDLVIAMARSMLRDGHPGDLVRRLQRDREQLAYLRAAAVADTATKLSRMMLAIAYLGRVLTVVPRERSRNGPLATAQTEVRTKVRDAIPAIGTSQEGATIAEVETASTTYTDVMTRELLGVARSVRDDLTRLRTEEQNPNNDIRPLDSNNSFVDGYARNNQIVLGWSREAFSTYQSERQTIEQQFARLEGLDTAAAGTLEERLAYLRGEGSVVLDLIQRGQGVMMLHAGLALGIALMHATTQATEALNYGDVFDARDIRDTVVSPLGEALAAGRVPSEAVLGRAQRTLSDQSGRVDARLTEINTQLRRFGYFVNFATMVLSLFAGMGAMRLAIGPVAVGRTLALGTFVRGSLAFTMASYTTSTVLSGRELDAGDLATQAAVDMATLGLMHYVGGAVSMRYAGRPPATVMAGAQFATLWGWSTSLSVVQTLTDDDPDNDPQSLGDILSMASSSGAHTAEAFAALAIAHRIGTLPRVPPVEGDASAAARAAMTEMNGIAEAGRQLDAEIQRWRQRGESPAELEGLMRRAEGWYGRYRRGVNGLVEAEVIDSAQASHLRSAVQPQIAQIRNLRDGARLGLRQTGALTTAYSGGIRNLDLYLNRLKRQGVITNFTPQGRTGVYEVEYTDGTRGFLYPEARAGGESVPSFTTEVVETRFPDAPQASRARVVQSLDTMPAGEASRVVAALGGPNGQVIFDFLSSAQTTAALARPNSFITPELVRSIGSDPQLRSLVQRHGEHLQPWFEAPFESVGHSRASRAFSRVIRQVLQYRGTLEVSSTAEARAIIGELARATEAFAFDPATYRRPAAFTRPGSPRSFDPAEWMSQHTSRQGLTGDFHQVGGPSSTTFVQVRNGQPVRAWIFHHRSTVAIEVPVARHLRLLREGLRNVDQITDTAARNAALEALRPNAQAVAFLRTIRGVDLADANQLIERVMPTERASTPPDPAPATPESTTPAAELVPLTRGEATTARRRALIDRAVRMGEIENPIVDALVRWQRTGHAPTDPTASLDATETMLDNLADAALRRWGRGGRRAQLAALREGAFSGRTDIGDVLHLTRNLQGITAKALRGLAYASRPPTGGQPIRVERIFELTRNNASDRTLALEAFADAVEFRHRLPDGTEVPIEGVYRMFREMTASRNHWRGGLWVLRDIVRPGGVGLANVAAFESVETRQVTIDGVDTTVERRYDVRLRSGQRLEYKSWTNWFPDSVRSQFRRDVLLRTSELTDLSGFAEIQWRFERRPVLREGRGADTRTRVMSESEAFDAVKAEMRRGLEQAMNDLGITDPIERQPKLDAFEARAPSMISIGAGP